MPWGRSSLCRLGHLMTATDLWEATRLQCSWWCWKQNGVRDENRERERGDLEGCYGDNRRQSTFTVNEHRKPLSRANIRLTDDVHLKQSKQTPLMQTLQLEYWNLMWTFWWSNWQRGQHNNHFLQAYITDITRGPSSGHSGVEATQKWTFLVHIATKRLQGCTHTWR